MRKKSVITRRRASSAKRSRLPTSVHHVQDIALMSAPAAANRLWQLRGASPIAIGAAMNRFALEKVMAFSSAWWAAGFATLSAQRRWLGGGTDMVREFETIAQKTLMPIATKVRHNSGRRASR